MKKMKYNPDIHHRRSIRLIGYDYSQAGLYFITICCNERIHHFGEITDGIMKINDAGKIANDIADEARASNISVYTIGLGSDLNSELMQSIATKPEQYYQAVSGSELSSVYAKIASAICKKSPSVIEIIPRINNVVPTLQTP